jgi:hypothetical protein
MGASVAGGGDRGMTVRVDSGVDVSVGVEVVVMITVSVRAGVSNGSRVAVGISVAEVNEAIGVGIAVRAVVAVAGMVVVVSVTVDGDSKVEVGERVRVYVSVARGVKSEGETCVSWTAQVAVLPMIISIPISNREMTSQQRNNSLAFMLSPLGCPVAQVNVQVPGTYIATLV